MGRGWRMALALGVMTALAGCEAGTFGQFDVDSGQSARMDASQRVLLVTNRGGRDGTRHVTCAEPSPDSLATFSLALHATAKNKVGDPTKPTADQEATFGSGFAQQAAYIGMRSQTIQLLRDGLYRACEGYMNGAIDEAQYNIMLVNMGHLMVSLVAIDGLTGRPAAPAVVTGLVTEEVDDGKGGKKRVVVPGAGKIEAVGRNDKAEQATAEAVQNIALASNNRDTLSALCLSFMASDRYGNPSLYGQNQNTEEFRSVAKMCRGVFDKLPNLLVEKAKRESEARAGAARPAAAEQPAPAPAPKAPASG